MVNNRKIDGKVHKLLRTLCEIQRILYLGEEYRTPKEILRLHNACFEHFILFKEIFNVDNLSAKMTRNKLFGKYQHNLLVHAPLQNRLLSGQSISCENVERNFNAFQNITRSTSNNHSDQVIDNIIIRTQIEGICKDKYNHKSNDNRAFRDIQDLGASVYTDENNTVFEYSYIKENPADWQVLLEIISDFLQYGKGV